MSEALQPPAEDEEESFEEWVERRRDDLEEHAESDYATAEIAAAFLDYVEGSS